MFMCILNKNKVFRYISNKDFHNLLFDCLLASGKYIDLHIR